MRTAITLLVLLVASHFGVRSQTKTNELQIYQTLPGGGSLYVCNYGTTGVYLSDKPCAQTGSVTVRSLRDYTDAEIVEELARRSSSKGLDKTDIALEVHCYGDGRCKFTSAQTVRHTNITDYGAWGSANGATLAWPNTGLATEVIENLGEIKSIVDQPKGNR